MKKWTSGLELRFGWEAHILVQNDFLHPNMYVSLMYLKLCFHSKKTSFRFFLEINEEVKNLTKKKKYFLYEVFFQVSVFEELCFFMLPRLRCSVLSWKINYWGSSMWLDHFHSPTGAARVKKWNFFKRCILLAGVDFSTLVDVS